VACFFGLLNSASATEIKSKDVTDLAAKKLLRIQSELYEEAGKAVDLTEKGLFELQHGKYKQATSSLEKAIGKIEVVTAKDSNLENILIDFRISTNDLSENNQFIRQERNKAKKALNRGEIQEAKKILDPLASEMIIEKYYLPLSSYPSFIRKSVRAIKDQNYLLN
jgi:outer membrane protein assembly factor BamD (BamD/ComL family)